MIDMMQAQMYKHPPMLIADESIDVFKDEITKAHAKPSLLGRMISPKKSF